jgi:hypothetical protein
MSATLNFNPVKYTSWKGNVFYKISSFSKKNNNDQSLKTSLFMNPLPMKIYRKELGKPNNCNEHISLDELNRPGSFIQSQTQRAGYTNYNTNDVTECRSINKNSCVNMPDVDARRRVRSAGMIRRKYDPSRNNDTYCTSSNQYLVSRNRTFSQNQYNFIRQGNSNVKPGTNLSKTNVYSPNGISHCIQPYISEKNGNNVFSYRWINNVTYQVTIPEGQYNIYTLNAAFQNVMLKNTHYFKNNTTQANEFLLNISYDNINKVVILENKNYTNFLNNINSLYTLNQFPLNNWNSVANPVQVVFQIPNTNFQNIIGFTSGNYGASSQTSTIQPNITQNYVTMNYKPNNPQFGQQGAVSSSSLITRKKYDTITSVGAKMKAPYGSATANALAYGVSDHQYTVKDKIGFPLKRTPVVSKFTGEIRCVNSNNLN